MTQILKCIGIGYAGSCSPCLFSCAIHQSTGSLITTKSKIAYERFLVWRTEGIAMHELSMAGDVCVCEGLGLRKPISGE